MPFLCVERYTMWCDFGMRRRNLEHFFDLIAVNCLNFRVQIHYIAADDSGSESRLIGRIEMGDKNDNSVSLCMTPELDQLTKLRLISTMILMVGQN